MPRAGFEPVTPATKRLQTYALDRAVTDVGPELLFVPEFHTGTNKYIYSTSTYLLSFFYGTSLFRFYEVYHSFTRAYSPGWTFGLPYRSFLITHIQTHGRTPLDE
jgi:hypothetical protein